MAKEKEKQEAIKLRTIGLTTKLISEKLNVSQNSVCKWVEGIQIPKQSYYDNINARSKYTYNLDLFITPNKITYYLLGAFMSDGCVDVSLRRISIFSIDSDWLIQISNYLCPDKSPQKRKTTNCYNLTINSRQITDWFVSNKCTQNKSLTLQMPDVPDQYFSHFVRGVFDGDGSIHINKQESGKTHSLNTYIVSASKSFIDSLSERFKILNINHSIVTISGKNRSIFGRPPKDYHTCYRITFRGSNAVKFCELIYSDSELFLDRKHLVYLKYAEMRIEELKTCQIRKQFESIEVITKLLKTNTHEEIAAMYGIQKQTLIKRLVILNLFKQVKRKLKLKSQI